MLKHIILGLSLLFCPLAFGAAKITSQRTQEQAVVASLSDVFTPTMTLPEMERKLEEAKKTVKAMSTLSQDEKNIAITILVSKFEIIKQDIQRVEHIAAANRDKNNISCQMADILISSFMAAPEAVRLTQSVDIKSEITKLKLFSSDHNKYIARINNIIEADIKKRKSDERDIIDTCLRTFNVEDLSGEARQKTLEEYQAKINKLVSVSTEEKEKIKAIFQNEVEIAEKKEALKAAKREAELKAAKEFEEINSVIEKLNKILAQDARSQEEKEALVKMVAEFFETNSINIVNKCKTFCPLYSAIFNDNLPLVKYLISIGIDLNKPMTVEQNTPLHTALKFERIDILQELLKIAKRNKGNLSSSSTTKTIDVNLSDFNGITPLMLAVEIGNIKAVRLLIEGGANLDLQDRVLYKTLEREQALDMRSKSPAKKSTAVQDMSTLHDIFPSLDFYKHSGETALMKAIRSENEDIIKLLINSGADTDLKAVRISPENTSLITAANIADTKSEETGKVLRETILHRRRNIQSEHLHDCIVNINYGQITEILRNALTSNTIDINYTDSEGRNLLLILLSTGTRFTNILDVSNFTDMLLNLGVDVNAQDNAGRTALHYVCINWGKYNSLSLIKNLFARGASVNKPDKNGETPLHYACRMNSKLDTNTLHWGYKIDPIITADLIKYLVTARGANINAVNKDLETPLMVAAQLVGSEYVIQILLELKANVTLQDKHQMTAYQIAQALGLDNNARLVAPKLPEESKRS